MGFLGLLAVVLSGGALFLNFFPTFIDVRPHPLLELPEIKFDGPLTPNTKLDAVEILFKDRADGPESLAYHKGAIYSGTKDGTIVKFTEENIEIVARIGERCPGIVEDVNCSRPLGVRLDKNGNFLYVADAYVGLVKINVKTGKFDVLIKQGELVESVAVTFLDDLDIDEDEGNIYVSDVSERWGLWQFLFSIFEHENSGRIYVKGEKKGTKEVFTHLPGHPDNIRAVKGGGYWVSLALGGTQHHFGSRVSDIIMNPPTIRGCVLRLAYFTGSVFEYLRRFYPLSILEQAAEFFKTGKCFTTFTSSLGMIVKLDEDGTIVRSLQASNPKLTKFSEVLDENGYLYLASFENSFLGRLKI